MPKGQEPLVQNRLPTVRQAQHEYLMNRASLPADILGRLQSWTQLVSLCPRDTQGTLSFSQCWHSLRVLPSDNEKHVSLSLPLLWLWDAYMSSWGVVLLATVPCPPLLFLICVKSVHTILAPACLGSNPGEQWRINSPLGTWEPHTSLSWWFLLCFVLFKQYEDNTSSMGPREERHQALPLQAYWFPSL